MQKPDKVQLAGQTPETQPDLTNEGTTPPPKGTDRQTDGPAPRSKPTKQSDRGLRPAGASAPPPPGPLCPQPTGSSSDCKSTAPGGEWPAPPSRSPSTNHEEASAPASPGPLPSSAHSWVGQQGGPPQGPAPPPLSAPAGNNKHKPNFWGPQKYRGQQATPPARLHPPLGQ